MRETLTTLGELLGAALIIAGVNVQFGRGAALTVAGVIVAWICWLLGEES